MMETNLHKIIVPISVYSAKYNHESYFLQIQHFLAKLKSKNEGILHVLIAENAHIHTFAAKHKISVEEAKKQTLVDALTLKNKIDPKIDGIEFLFWNQFVESHSCYNQFHEQIRLIAGEDKTFSDLMTDDIIKAWERLDGESDKDAFCTLKKWIF